MPLIIWIVVFLIVVLFIYLWWRRSNQETVFEKYQGAGPTYGQKAKKLYKEVKEKPNKTATDWYVLHSLVKNNILEGRAPPQNKQLRTTRRRVLTNFPQIAEPMRDFVINDLQEEENDEALQRAIQLSLEQRKEASKAKTKKKSINNYIKSSQRVMSDSQNSHDTTVNTDIRREAGRLSSNEGRLHEIENWIRTNYNGEKRDKALKALSRSLNGHEVIETFGVSERGMLSKVWQRAYEPKNNEKDIKNAVVDALADCVEDRGLVCTNGRMTRVYGALSAIDHDPKVNNLMTHSMYKNQIFQETKKIIDKEVKKAKRSKDPELQKVAQSFTENVEVNPEVEERFIEKTKKKIVKNVGRYKDKLTPAQIETLAVQCQASI